MGHHEALGLVTSFGMHMDTTELPWVTCQGHRLGTVITLRTRVKALVR